VDWLEILSWVGLALGVVVAFVFFVVVGQERREAEPTVQRITIEYIPDPIVPGGGRTVLYAEGTCSHEWAEKNIKGWTDHNLKGAPYKGILLRVYGFYKARFVVMQWGYDNEGPVHWQAVNYSEWVRRNRTVP
jgi:hypothetical protein